jgi:hypothetical protein
MTSRIHPNSRRLTSTKYDKQEIENIEFLTVSI